MSHFWRDCCGWALRFFIGLCVLFVTDGLILDWKQLCHKLLNVMSGDSSGIAFQQRLAYLWRSIYITLYAHVSHPSAASLIYNFKKWCKWSLVQSPASFSSSWRRLIDPCSLPTSTLITTITASWLCQIPLWWCVHLTHQLFYKELSAILYRYNPPHTAEECWLSCGKMISPDAWKASVCGCRYLC